MRASVLMGAVLLKTGAALAKSVSRKKQFLGADKRAHAVKRGQRPSACWALSWTSGEASSRALLSPRRHRAALTKKRAVLSTTRSYKNGTLSIFMTDWTETV